MDLLSMGIVVNSQSSKVQQNTADVLQDSLFGCTLFLYYIKYMSKNMLRSLLNIYAEDTKMYGFNFQKSRWTDLEIVSPLQWVNGRRIGLSHAIPPKPSSQRSTITKEILNFHLSWWMVVFSGRFLALNVNLDSSSSQISCDSCTWSIAKDAWIWLVLYTVTVSICYTSPLQESSSTYTPTHTHTQIDR